MKPRPYHFWECSFLKNEDICGFGYCEISDRERSCRDKCEFGFYQMKATMQNASCIIARGGDEVQSANNRIRPLSARQ